MRRRGSILLLAATAACGSAGTAEESPTTPLPTPPPTVAGVGALPDTIPVARALRDEPLVVITRPVSRDGVLVELVGDRVNGNRLLLIGDSIFAGTAQRYGGEMCAGLVPLGWAVAVEAEAGRFVDFGTKVVERLVPESPAGGAVGADDTDWDAAAVFLGSNYRGDAAEFEAELRTILDRLAPRPTLLYTVTEYRPAWAEVNEVILAVADEYDGVTVIDWEEVARTPGVLMADGLHPGDEGEQVLVELTAAALGRAQAGDGECLRETFRDDSAINEGVGTPNTGRKSGGSRGSSSGGSTRSTSPATTSPGTTSPGTTSPGTTSPGTTSPGTTSPGTTSPGTTAPPTTSPPTTSPATTSPATTSPPPPPPTPPPPTQPPPPPPPTVPPTTGP